MSILSDIEIAALAEQGMITPFESNLIRELDETRVISYGLSSYGYDIRLSPTEFLQFVPVKEFDPKRPDPNATKRLVLNHDDQGAFFLMPPFSFGLGVAMERLEMPPDVTAIAMGKSTYARAGLSCHVTPSEAGWRGHLTLEFNNNTPSPTRIYAGEGVTQLLFFRGEPCRTCYETRSGKYQDQPHRVIMGTV